MENGYMVHVPGDEEETMDYEDLNYFEMLHTASGLALEGIYCECYGPLTGDVGTSMKFQGRNFIAGLGPNVEAVEP